MSPDAAIEFLALSYVTTPETAQIRIDAARRAGATEAECAEAWTAWKQMRAGDVRQIHSQPTPKPVCRCSHSHGLHLYGSGRCHQTACGCGFFRKPDSIRRRMDEDRYDPSPYGIDRSIS